MSNHDRCSVTSQRISVPPGASSGADVGESGVEIAHRVNRIGRDHDVEAAVGRQALGGLGIEQAVAHLRVGGKLPPAMIEEHIRHVGKQVGRPGRRGSGPSTTSWRRCRHRSP